MQHGGHFISRYYNNSLIEGKRLSYSIGLLLAALKSIYPSYEWKSSRQLPPKRGSRTQAFLLRALRNFLPETPILESAIVPPGDTKLEDHKLKYYEFDVSFVIFILHFLFNRYSFLTFHLHLNIKENNTTFH
jgi:hypothetical protein